MLKIEQVRIAYQNGQEVIRDVSLEVARGEMLALIGPNGSGKTTLIRGLSGITPLCGGQVSFDGMNLQTMAPRVRARLLAVVPQAANLPSNYTVYETTAHGRTPYLNWFGQLSKADRRIIDEAIRLTELRDYIHQEVSSLSGGEQQRVILARALAQDTPVLILDEPTTFLDLHYQVSLLELVRSICTERQLAVLFIMHELNLASRFADRIAILKEGRIAAVGTPHEVLQEKLLSDVFSVPVRVIPDLAESPLIFPI